MTIDRPAARELLITLTQQAHVSANAQNMTRSMKPAAIVWLMRPDTGWEMSAAFQGVVRAARFMAIAGYDKPAALVFQEANGWEVEFYGL